MESDGGLIENEEGVDEGRTEAGGEVDAFDFAAGEGARGAVEGEVAEANLTEVVEAGQDGVSGEIGLMVTEWAVVFFQEVEEVVQRQSIEVREGVAEPFPVKGLGLKASSLAAHASCVGAVF